MFFPRRRWQAMSSTLVFSTGLSKRAIWPPASCFGSTRPRPHCKIAAGFLPPAATIGWRSTGVLNDRRDCRGLDESPARIAGSLYIIIIVGAVFAPFLLMSGGEYLTPFQPDQLLSARCNIHQVAYRRLRHRFDVLWLSLHRSRL